MKLIVKTISVSLLGLLFTAGLASAQEDLPDSKDHPLLTRMPNFYISDYEYNKFEAADFKDLKGEDIQVEGHIFDIYYQIKEGKKAPGKLQVLKNYENAIKKIGGSTVYEAGKEAWLKVEKGGKTTWAMKCSGKDAMKMTGKMTCRGNSLEGTMIMISNDPDGGKIKITNHMSGKRIGECK